jgi:uncharacterized membrane protein YbhN (UPF0104 family)
MSLTSALPLGVRRAWPAVRLIAGGVLVCGLLWRFGTGPVADAWRVTTWGSLAAAVALTALATVANAWRWRVVARALGVPLAPGESVAAYYRSQFLNATLPGGVLGDAHRGIRHGRDAGDLGAGLRATVWDRATGQLVQTGLLLLALVVLPTPLRGYAPLVLVGLGVVVAVAWWAALRAGPTGFVGDDLRLLLRPGLAARVLVASGASTAAHVGVFLVAVAAVGRGQASPAVLVAIGLAVLVGSAVPLNVAGWGPREGVTAGVFALAGLGSAHGLTVSIVFGVMSAVSTLPGAVVMLGEVAVRRRTHDRARISRRVDEVCRG